MLDNYHVGYDLAEAGYNFAPAKGHQNINLELLDIIASDFVKISVDKKGLQITKDEILDKLNNALPSVSHLQTVIVFSINNEGVVSKKVISKQSPMYKELFLE
jgi:hypothetical protein